MSNDLATLYELQQVDTHIHELEAERDALESGAELRAEVEALRAEVQADRDALRALEAELRDTELDMKTREAKKKSVEDKMYSGSIRNPKELEDMQREVKMLGDNIDKLEDKALNMMDDVEQRRAALGERESVLREQEARLGEVEGNYDAECARIAGEIAGLEAQRATLVPAIPKDLLRRYDELRVRRDNVAIVKVTAETCPGCRISLSVDTLRRLKRGERNLACESCARILYAEITEPPPERPAEP